MNALSQFRKEPYCSFPYIPNQDLLRVEQQVCSQLNWTKVLVSPCRGFILDLNEVHKFSSKYLCFIQTKPSFRLNAN